MLNVELNELRRIRDEGILTQHAYEDAKARILQINL
jgi:hypothetical protein